jgi:MFS family permease
MNDYRALWVVIAAGTTLMSPLVCSIAIVSRFTLSRGLALSVAATGSNIAGVVMPLLATSLIQQLGWRWAYVALASCMFLCTFCIALVAFFDAGDLRVRSGQARHMSKEAGAIAAKNPGGIGLTLSEAARARTFWLMLFSFPVAGAAILGMVVHLIPLLHERGLTPMAAAGGASMMSIGAIAGRLGEGVFMDRVFAPRIAAVTFTAPILACLGLLMLPVNMVTALVYAFMFGIALGAELSLVSYLCSRYFGLKCFGLVYGVQFSMFTIGCALGPPLVGVMYQLHGNYRIPLIVLACSYFFSAMLLQFCGRYPNWQGSMLTVDPPR